MISKKTVKYSEIAKDPTMRLDAKYWIRKKLVAQPKKQKLAKLIKKLNKENAPPGGWSSKDGVVDKPEAGKTYALTGATGSRCIANGNSWKESEVDEGSGPEEQDGRSRSVCISSV